MQKSYVVKRQIYFQPAETYLRNGDILVHDPANQNKLTIFRNKEIIKITAHTVRGLEAMRDQKPDAWIEEIPNTTPDAAVAAQADNVPDPAPPVENPVVTPVTPAAAADAANALVGEAKAAEVAVPIVETPADAPVAETTPVPAPATPGVVVVPSPPAVTPVIASTAPAPEPTQNSGDKAAAAVAKAPVVNLADLTKADIVDHAKKEHGLELDVNLKKSELIQAIDEHKEAAAGK